MREIPPPQVLMKEEPLNDVGVLASTPSRTLLSARHSDHFKWLFLMWSLGGGQEHGAQAQFRHDTVWPTCPALLVI